MKQTLLFMSLLICMLSCTKKGNELPTTITLEPDKREVIADGLDKVRFEVLSDRGNLTAQSILFVNNKPIQGNQFSSEEAGSYTFTAQYEGIVSLPVEIQFIKRLNSQLSIVTSKTQFVADGGDRVVFACIDRSSGSESVVTGETTFLVNGEPIEGNSFQTTSPGTYTVSAHYRNDRITDIEVVAQNDFRATQRLYAELFVASWCPFCPAGLLLMNEVTKVYPDIIALALHPKSEDQPPFHTDGDGYQLYEYYGIASIPSIVLDRDKEQIIRYADMKSITADDIIAYAKPEAKVGIAMRSRVTDNVIHVEAAIATKENATDIKCVAILAENNVIHDQRNKVRPELGDPIEDMVHNHLYRNSANTIFGESIALSTEQPLRKSFSFTPDPSIVVEQSEVILLITDADGKAINVQRVKVGEETGY